MKRFEFFNKQQSVVGDSNTDTTQIYSHLAQILETFTRKGFLDTYTDDDYGFSIHKPDSDIFSIGSSGADYLTISSSSGTIFGIDAVGNPLIINTNNVYQTTDTTQNAGNVNVPLTGGSKPYTNYVWLVYRETSLKETGSSRTDYDGGTHYPIKNHGYEWYITTNASYIHAAGLLIGAVTVNADNSHTYDFTNRLIAGIRDTAIKVKIPAASADYTAAYEAGDDKTLNEHISAIGSGTISEVNPHGLKPADIDAFDGVDLQTNRNFVNGIIPNANNNYAPLEAKIYNSGVTHYVYYTLTTPAWVPKFMWNSVVYAVSTLTPTATIDGFTAAYVSFTAESAGWYLIKITKSSSAFILTKSTALSNPGSIRETVGDSDIWLGWVYWNGTTLTRNEDTAAANGDSILSSISYSFLDKAALSKEPTEFDMISQNLIPNASGEYSTAYNKYLKDPEIIMSQYLGSGSPQKASIKLTVNTNGVFRQLRFKQNFKRAQGGDTKKYTLSFKYIGATGVSARITFGGKTYYLPKTTVEGLYYYLALSSNEDDVVFEFNTVLTASVYINSLQLYQGHCPTKNYVESMIPTNKIIFDNEQNLFVNGEVAPIETRIEKIDLNGILQKLPFADIAIKTGGAASTQFANFASEAKNLEMWFVRVGMTKPGTYSNKSGYTYSHTYSWGASPSYKFVWGNFNVVGNLGVMYQAPDSADYAGRGALPLTINDITATSLQLQLQFWSTNELDGVYASKIKFPAVLAVEGIMIMQRV